jgi:hypothetical protein
MTDYGVPYKPSQYLVVGSVEGDKFVADDDIIIEANTEFNKFRSATDSNRMFYEQIGYGLIGLGIISGAAEVYFLHDEYNRMLE